jgi:hypothetical protein
MPSIQLLTAFLLATCVFAYMPGPTMMYATAQIIARGRRTGYQSANNPHSTAQINPLISLTEICQNFVSDGSG